MANLKTVVIISSCTKKKARNPDNMITLEDFKDKSTLEEKKANLKEEELKASEMYKGNQHLLLMEGLNKLRKKYPDITIELYIISAGYGLVGENYLIVPYEVTFSDMKPAQIIEWSRKLRIKENLQKVINKYDIAIFIIGNEYLKAVELPFEEASETKLIFITCKTAAKKNIPDKGNYFVLKYGNEKAKSFGRLSIELKGYLIKVLCEEIANSGGELLDTIYEDPCCIKDLLRKHEK